MEWLITADVRADLDDLRQRLRRCGAEVHDETPAMPLGEGEIVLAVTGPPDLRMRAAGEPGIVKISPNSEQTLY